MDVTMETARLEALRAVVEQGSMTRAARSLGYTQSALSQMIASLEAHFGFRLLDRGRGGCVPTLEGARVFPFVEQALASVRVLEEQAAEINGLECGVVRMGTIASVSAHWLPPLMRRFEEEHPGVEFVIHQGDYALIPEWIRSGLVDFGFASPKGVSGLTCDVLGSDPLVAVLPKGHSLAKLSVVPLEELAKEPYILLEEGGYFEPLEAFEGMGLAPEVKYTIHDDYSIMSMVEQGLGVTMLADLIMRRCPYDVVARPTDPPVERTLALVYESESKLPIAAKRFMALIKESQMSKRDVPKNSFSI